MNRIPQRMPLKVVHLALSLDVGGLERMILDLADQASSFDQQPTIVCLERPGALASVAQQRGIAVHCVDKRPGQRPETVVHLFQLFQCLRPDVVHTHQMGALFYGGPAASMARVRAVLHTEHGLHFDRSWRLRALGRFAGFFCDRLCGVAPAVADHLLRHQIVPPHKLRVIPNGIDTGKRVPANARTRLRDQLGVAPDETVIGAVGRLANVKGMDLLVRAFAEVQRHFPRSVLLVVGDGPERANLEQFCRQLQVEDQVRFVGFRRHPERYLEAMDLFVQSSRSEGMPLALLEAWSARLPVVATRVGGTNGIVADGQNGLLVEPENVAQLAAGIERLLSDRTSLTRLGVEGWRTVTEQFDRRRMAAAYDLQYRKLVHSSRRLACAS